MENDFFKKIGNSNETKHHQLNLSYPVKSNTLFGETGEGLNNRFHDEKKVGIFALTEEEEEETPFDGKDHYVIS